MKMRKAALVAICCISVLAACGKKTQTKKNPKPTIGDLIPLATPTVHPEGPLMSEDGPNRPHAGKAAKDDQYLIPKSDNFIYTVSRTEEEFERVTTVNLYEFDEKGNLTRHNKRVTWKGSLIYSHCDYKEEPFSDFEYVNDSYCYVDKMEQLKDFYAQTSETAFSLKEFMVLTLNDALQKKELEELIISKPLVEEETRFANTKEESAYSELLTYLKSVDDLKLTAQRPVKVEAYETVIPGTKTAKKKMYDAFSYRTYEAVSFDAKGNGTETVYLFFDSAEDIQNFVYKTAGYEYDPEKKDFTAKAQSPEQLGYTRDGNVLIKKNADVTYFKINLDKENGYYTKPYLTKSQIDNLGKNTVIQ